MPAWFVEQRHFDGSWVPVVYHGERPATRTATGVKRVFRRDPIEVNTGHAKLPLSQLADLYGQDGKFRGAVA